MVRLRHKMIIYPAQRLADRHNLRVRPPSGAKCHRPTADCFDGMPMERGARARTTALANASLGAVRVAPALGLATAVLLGIRAVDARPAHFRCALECCGAAAWV